MTETAVNMEDLVEPASLLSVAPGPPYDFQRDPYLTYIAKEFANTAKVSNNFLRGCKWAPDGSCLLSNSADSVLRVFNVPDLNVLPLEPQDWRSVLRIKEVDLVYDYCWYPKMSSLDAASSCFLTTPKTAPIHLWDAFTGALRASYVSKSNVDSVVAALSVAMDPSGSLIYAGFDNAVRVFDISRPGEDCDIFELGKKHGQQGGIISCIAFDPSGVDLVAFGSYNRSIGLYTTDGDVQAVLEGHNSGVTHLKFSSDGLRLYSGARLDNSIFCWDLRTYKVLREFHREIDTNQRVYFDIDPMETYLCSGQRDGLLCLWPLKDTGVGAAVTEPLKPRYQFAVHGDMVNGVTWHPLWPLLTTASGQRHVPAPLVEENEDDKDQVERICIQENSLKLWYIG